jgi:hypothetical protein
MSKCPAKGGISAPAGKVICHRALALVVVLAFLSVISWESAVVLRPQSQALAVAWHYRRKAHTESSKPTQTVQARPQGPKTCTISAQYAPLNTPYCAILTPANIVE